jgi:hypothetical protein
LQGALSPSKEDSVRFKNVIVLQALGESCGSANPASLPHREYSREFLDLGLSFEVGEDCLFIAFGVLAFGMIEMVEEAAVVDMDVEQAGFLSLVVTEKFPDAPL